MKPKNKLISLILLLVCLHSGTQLWAQLNPDYLSAIPETNRSEVFDVLPDRMGNIWMATHSGLMRYDGYELRHYYPDPNDSTTIGDILTYRLYEDSRGRIWIGSMDFISVYDPQNHTFQNYTYAPLTDFPMYSQAFILTISEDKKGRIYFGVNSMLDVNANHALLYFDEKENILKPFEAAEELLVNNVFETAADPLGNIWILCLNGIYRIDTLHKLSNILPPSELLSSNEFLFKALISDSLGNIWMANDKLSLYKYNPVNQTYQSWSMNELFVESIEEASVMELAVGPKNNIWLATNQGLVSFDPILEKFKAFDHQSQKNSKEGQIYSMRFDPFGDLWIATSSNGMMRYSEQTILNSFISKSDDPTSLTSGWAYKMFEMEDGSIWVSTGGGNDFSGMNLLDFKNQQVKPFYFQQALPDLQYCTAIAEIEPNKILIDTDEGYNIFNTTDLSLRPALLDAVFDTTHLFNIYSDSHQNTWYCTVDGLYRKQMNSNGYINYNLQEIEGSNLISNEITNVYESKNNGLWLLSNYGLFLYHYDTDSIERIGNDPSLGDVFSSQDINSLYEDPTGIAWVGTWKGGLSRFDPASRKIKTYTIEDGLPSMNIQGILADEKNHVLWLSTFEGLSRFNIEDEKFNNFSLGDGIQGTLFADGSCLISSEGYFIFGGINGVTWFKPEDIIENSKAPLVFITDFKVGNISLNLPINHKDNLKSGKNDKLNLTYTKNNISIGYTGVHYANPSKNIFAYKLENYNDDWQEVGNLRTAYYYGLPPGSYTFRVKAANSNGVWNEEGASISFIIKPPWWKTWWAYGFYILFIIAAFIAFDRIQQRRVVERERRIAREKELQQAKEIEKAYHQLKTTQSQLVHAEKMASLGELTAGIAHEIQNPLNFVNNFAELNSELIDELREEIEKGDKREALNLTDDIAGNEQKIAHHGKRADAIVKGMLQHSRSSIKEKEPTNINALADEYLRLAYHGLRAKDKTFNADFKTDFDPELPQINIIPQDIGRVLLNLVNNAFYVVNEKVKKSPMDYNPEVVVSTKRLAEKIEIRVKDNGSGIPESILEKIFQPFFTTKPTGEGTGLGLSMSYDIITKGHNGEIKVNSMEGKGTEFIIILPSR
jgi:signal transduction histidine kinase/ligand-binding sensor domain-containing protein